MPEPELDLEQDARVTHYGYEDDPTPDSNSLAGIGNHNNHLIPGSLGFSPDLIERYNLQYDDPVDIRFPDGTIFHGTYGDQTADEYQGRPIRNTVDVYDPYKYFSDEDLNQAKIVVRPKSRVHHVRGGMDEPEKPTPDNTSAEPEETKPEAKDPPTFVDKYREKFPIYKNKDAFSDQDLAREIRNKYGYGNISEDLFIDEATRHDNGKGLSEEIDSHLTGIDRLRRHYPQYSDLSDEQLLKGLYDHHPELQKEPFENFQERMKPLDPTSTAIRQNQMDFIEGVGTGAVQGWNIGLSQLYSVPGLLDAIGKKADEIGDQLHDQIFKPLSESILGYDYTAKEDDGNKSLIGGLLDDGWKNLVKWTQEVSKGYQKEAEKAGGGGSGEISTEDFQKDAALKPKPPPTLGGVIGNTLGNVIGQFPSSLASWPVGAEAKGAMVWGALFEGTTAYGRALEAKRDNAFVEGGLAAGTRSVAQLLMDTPNGRIASGVLNLLLGQSEEQVQSWLDGKNRTPEDLTLKGGIDFLTGIMFGHSAKVPEYHFPDEAKEVPLELVGRDQRLSLTGQRTLALPDQERGFTLVPTPQPVEGGAKPLALPAPQTEETKALPYTPTEHRFILVDKPSTEPTGGAAQKPTETPTTKPKPAGRKKPTPIPEGAQEELRKAVEANANGDTAKAVEHLDRALSLLPKTKRQEIAKDIVALKHKIASKKVVNAQTTKDAVTEVTEVAKGKKTAPTTLKKAEEPHYARREEQIAAESKSLKEVQDKIKAEYQERINQAQTQRQKDYIKKVQLPTALTNGRIQWEQKLRESKAEPAELPRPKAEPTKPEVTEAPKAEAPKTEAAKPETPSEPEPLSEKDEVVKVTQLENGRWQVKLEMPDGKVMEQTFATEKQARNAQEGLYKYYQEYKYDNSADEGFDYYHFGFGDPFKMINDWIVRNWPKLRALPGKIPVVKEVKEAVEDWLDKWYLATNPGYRSDIARAAEGILRRGNAVEKFMVNTFANEIARDDKLEDDIVGGSLNEKREKFWSKFSSAEVTRILANFQRGLKSADKYVQRMLDYHDRTMKALQKLEESWGIMYDNVENYIHGIYRNKKDAERVIKLFNMRYPKDTPLHPKEFQNFLEAAAAGFQLRYPNLERIDQARIATSAYMINKIKSLDALAALKMAVNTTRTEGAKAPNDWVKIVAPNRETYFVHPDAAAPFTKRFDSSPSIMQGVWSPFVKFAQILKGVGSKFKLTWGLFHPLHVSAIHAANNLVQNIWALAQGHGQLKPTLSSLFDTMTLGVRHLAPESAPEPYRNVLDLMLGKRSKKEASAEEKLMIKQLLEAGFVPNVSHERSLEWAHNIVARYAPASKIARNLTAAAEFGLRWGSLEPFQRYIFERTIPLMKAQATLRMVNDQLKARPELNDPKFKDERARVMRDIGRTIDGRYGEMNYDNLFWDKNAKIIGIASLLSLGWKLSLFRVYGGAVHDMTSNVVYLDDLIKTYREKGTGAAFNKAFSNNILFATAYTAIGAAGCGALSYLMTGKRPEDPMDWFFPNAGTDPSGRVKRLHTPFFAGELATLMQHFNQEGWFGGVTFMKNSLNPGASTVADMLANRDYQGREITSWSPHDKNINQFADLAGFAVKNMFAPISTEPIIEHLTGTEHGERRGFRDYIFPFIGLSPAAAWTTRSATENDIIKTWASEHGGTTKLRVEQEIDNLKADLKDAVQTKDHNREAKVRQQLEKLGVSDRSIKTQEQRATWSTGERLLNQIETNRQVDILKGMGPKDLEKYYPHASKKARELFDEYLESKKKKKIPHMQEGGVVTEPTTALVGESGPEAIIPLNDPSKAEVVTKPTVTMVGTKGPEAVVPVSDLNKGALGGANWGTVGSTVAQGDPDWTELDKKMLRFQLSRADRLSPTSGRHQVNPLSKEADIDPDYTIPHPFHEQKGGTVEHDQFPWKDYEETVGGGGAPKEDTLIPDPGYKSMFTTEEDFHTLPYNYGDKLPHNRGIPIPDDSDLMNPQLAL